MPTYIIFFIVGLSLLAIVDFLLSIETTSPIGRRKNQQRSFFTENVLKEKLNQTIKNRVKTSKRLKTEEKLAQAGLNMEYVDYVLLSLVSSVFFAVSFGYAASNILLGFIFLFLGYLVPGQVIGMIENKRTALLDKQIGSFMQMVTKRYENTKDFHRAMTLTVPEFEGEEPIYSELKRTLAEMNLGSESDVALSNFAKRAKNKFMFRYATYYKMVASIGKEDTRKDLLGQAIKQYQENYQIKRSLKKEISGPVSEAYIMIGFVPVIAVYQSVTNDQYIYVMTQTLMGRVGTAGVVSVLLFIIWFVNNKLGAPLD